MEKAARVAIVPASFDWNDIGSWNSIAELIPADAQGNRIEGDAVTHNVTNTYLHSETRVIGAIGLDDIMVVDTPDALLVAHRSQVQDIKVLVNQLKARGFDAATQHRTASRPWGTYTVLEDGPALQDQAHRGQARRRPVAADAPPPRRALDRRGRHGPGHQRRQGAAAADQRVHLHSRRATNTAWRTPASSRW